MIRIFTTLCILCIVCICTYNCHSAECVFWDGHIEKGSVSLHKGALKLQNKAGTQKIKISDLLEIRYARSAYTNTHMQRIFLKNGSILSAQIGASSDFTEIPARSPTMKNFTLSGQQIYAIEFSDLTPGAQVDTQPSGPHSISRNGKVVSCDIEWMTKRDLSIKTKAGRIKLRRQKIHRIVLGGAKKTTSNEQGDNDIILRTKYNDTLYAKLLTLSSTYITIKTSIGTMKYPIQDLVSISTINQRVEKLTLKKPIKISETPHVDFIRTHKFDSNLFGAPIIMNGIRYESGIAMHSRCSIIYQLNGNYTAFVADYGIDTSVTNKGNAEFIIRSGDKELLRKTVTGTDPVQSIYLDLSGLTELELIVDYGSNGSGGDHGIWARPRLIK